MSEIPLQVLRRHSLDRGTPTTVVYRGSSLIRNSPPFRGIVGTWA